MACTRLLIAASICVCTTHAFSFVAVPGCRRGAHAALQRTWPRVRPRPDNPLRLNMCGRDDTDRAPNADGDASSIGELLALPTGEMFRQVGRYLLQPRISIPAFLAATSFLSVALASTLIFAFFTTTDIRILDTSENSDKSSKSILLFGEVLKDLEDGYVDKVDTDTLFQTAAEAMTASLDPYTEFESKTEAPTPKSQYVQDVERETQQGTDHGEGVAERGQHDKIQRTLWWRWHGHRYLTPNRPTQSMRHVPRPCISLRAHAPAHAPAHTHTHIRTAGREGLDGRRQGQAGRPLALPSLQCPRGLCVGRWYAPWRPPGAYVCTAHTHACTHARTHAHTQARVNLKI